MSTFEGKFKEESLDFIRVDNFQSRNYDGTFFFLSHFHTDHFRGIFEEDFLKVLTEDDSKILYCSELTRFLILRKPQCKIPSNKIIPLIVSASYILEYENRQPVSFTTIPSGHCPGSVMFLFEQGDIRVLYTGDFRIKPIDLCNIKALHDESNLVKNITSLYLDTTFCDPKWLSFPSRDQTIEDLVTLINDWLEDDPSHEIGIWYNSYHGLEPLLIDVAKALKTYIWIIDTESYISYSSVPELHDVLRRNKENTRIHVCPVRTQGNCFECSRNRAKTKTIKPCAQSFDKNQLELSRLKEGRNVTRIAYSMHCSLEELIKTVKYLSPGKVYPCALPNNLTFEEVLRNLQLDVEELRNVSENKKNQVSNDSELPPTKRFCPYQGLENNFSDEPEVIELSSDEEDDTKSLSRSDFGVLDSPPF